MKNQIISRIKEVFELADELYGFNLPFDDVVLNFTKVGCSAGKAGWRWTESKMREYHLQFSLESAAVDIDEMLNDTIPHEVAHLVNFYIANTGKNHDAGWVRTCVALGGTGKRTHTQNLTKAVYRKVYLYVTDSGDERIVKSAAKHRKIQRGAEYRINTTRELYGARHFKRTISADEHRAMDQSNITSGPKPIVKPIVKPVVKSTSNKVTTTPKSKKSTGIPVTKADVVKLICIELSGQPRKVILSKIMLDCGMSKAGASTYFYKYR